MRFMKIRLMIADHDPEYANRLISFLSGSYADELEIYSFSEVESLEAFLRTQMADVLLLSERLNFETERLPGGISFAYFSDSPEVDTIKGCRTVCRYQKLDLLYKEVLSLYSEKETNITGYKAKSTDSASLLVFLPASGGVGASAAAAAASVHIARSGKRVLYLNLEQCSDMALVFAGSGQSTMSDVVYAIKGNKSNLKLRLQAMVEQSPENVHFFSSSPVPLDSMELNEQDFEKLLQELQEMGAYDYIVLDMDNYFLEKLYVALRRTDRLVLVGDGSQISNGKLQRYAEALELLSKTQNLQLERKTMLLYNKFSSRTGTQINLPNISLIGGLPRFEGASFKQVVEEIAKSSVFEKLI